MQNIIIKKKVEVPGMPLFRKGQKVRVSDEIADILVDRGFATYDQGEKAVTEKAKVVQKARAAKDKATTKSK